MVETLSIVVLISILFFAWWRLFFHKKPEESKPLEEKYKKILQKHVTFYQDLSAEEKLRFEKSMVIFLAKIAIIGVETELEDKDRVYVAASGVIPLFGFPGWEYSNISEVLIYEGSFNKRYDTKAEDVNILGMVGSGEMHRIMILSKPALRQGFEMENDARNVGIHEFVHLIDKLDGTTDGLPEYYMDRQYAVPWMKMIFEEIKSIKTGDSDINPYGATSESEFFSVVSEYFFKQPDLFELKHPELFAMLNRIFRRNN